MFDFLKKSFAVEVDMRSQIKRIAELANNVAPHTPDYWKLQQSMKHPVFVYGREMTHLRSNAEYQLQQGDYRGVAFTYEPHSLFAHRLGKETFPIMLKMQSKEPYRPWAKSSVLNIPYVKVKGELYSLDALTIRALDTICLNGVYFKRRRTPIIVPYREASNIWDLKMKVTWAYVYHGNKDHWDDLIDNGFRLSPVRTFRSTIGEYYLFTALDFG